MLRRVLAVCVAGASATMSPAAAASGGGPQVPDIPAEGTVKADSEAGTSTKTPIKHFITVMQENHTFDNYFGTYPGADGLPPGVCMLVDSEAPDAGCVEPFWIGDKPVIDLGHNKIIFDEQYNEGKLDGFISAYTASRGGEVVELPMGHYDDRDLPYYWNVADNYVLFDRFFTSARGGSVSNHMFWVAGQHPQPPNAAEVIPPDGFDIPTIFDRLEQKGVSWKFYVQNYDPTITFRNPTKGDRGAQAVWVPILNFPRFVDDPAMFAHIVPLEQYYEDLTANTLPAVSYIVPSGASEHPPGSIAAGSVFIQTLIGSLMRSPAWSTSAFTWTYDDWGGWYDHVVPPTVDEYGYGFRAPALLVSARAKKGFIDHTTMDFTSHLKFISDNWGTAPLATRDAKAESLMTAFDFDSPPRPPVFLPAERNIPAAVAPKRGLIYSAYFGAVGMCAFLVLVGAVGLARRRRPAVVVGS